MEENRVVFITGGTSAIGRELVIEFARNKYDIAFSYQKNADDALETIRLVEREYKSKCISMQLDVASETDVSRVFGKVEMEFGRIDVLINNAGVFNDGLVKRLSLEKWQNVIDINLTGAFLCSKACIPMMEQQKFGRIINIGSVVGDTGAVGASNYAASKAGLIGLTKAIARETASKGITANVVSLGYMNVGMGARLPEKVMEAALKSIPMKKFGDINGIVRMIVCLASEDAEYITGQTIGMNGGLSM